MLRRLLGKLGLARPSRSAPPQLPDVDRQTVAVMTFTRHALPQLNWPIAAPWIAARAEEGPARTLLTRAVVARWLEELRDAMPTDHRCWRTADVEGVAPLDSSISILRHTERAIRVVGDALERIRATRAISPFGIVALATHDDYLSFQSHFGPSQGEFATSGGCYLSTHHTEFPLIAFPCASRWSLGNVIAHELTHHALFDLDLPIWIEEGLTQMMEERATGTTSFVLNREMLERHRDRWSHGRLQDFLGGRSFHSPQDDDQELSYHLAQLVVRSELQARADAYFKFVRAIPDIGLDAAATWHLRESPRQSVARIIGLDE
jgi:hypothetical protein